MKMKYLLCLLLCFVLSGFTDAKKNVLIIGDSISMGYTPYVKAGMADRANVVHNQGNAQYTDYGLENLDRWLGSTEWDVIYFNFGLHDLCYRDRQKKGMASRDKVNGELETTLKDYGTHLTAIVQRLKQTGAKLIFATTTYVPDNEPGRFEKDVARYNKVAMKVMKKQKVQVDDLYGLSLEIFPEYGNGSNDVHYKREGYQIFADHVAKTISEHF